MSRIPVRPGRGIFGAAERFLRHPSTTTGNVAWPSVRIDRARPGDGVGILQAHRSSFQSTYAEVPGMDVSALSEFVRHDLTPRKILEWSRKADAGSDGLYVARSNNRIIGFAEISPDSSGMELSGLYVMFSRMGYGNGNRLLSTVLNDIPPVAPVSLHVAKNTSAVEFYRRHDFVIVGEAETPPPLQRARVHLPQWIMRREGT
ncbi:GNAT family N-acetyltransferase [Streptosporangium sp. CA-135522]|uniref:GNAT family N-acetyltransferase n=1 Tax=Streptosporangium sp. CA-135522 TaxID=3240072 RepID=UPI003D91AAA2